MTAKLFNAFFTRIINSSIRMCELKTDRIALPSRKSEFAPTNFAECDMADLRYTGFPRFASNAGSMAAFTKSELDLTDLCEPILDQTVTLHSSAKSRISERNLKSLHKSNERLHRKMEAILAFLKTIATGNEADSGSTVTNLSVSPKSSCRFLAVSSLQEQRTTLLAKVKVWSAAAPDHREIIRLLEKYKQSVCAHIQSRPAEKNKLAKFVAFLQSSNRTSEAQEPHQEKTQRALKRKRSEGVWSQISAYFTPIEQHERVKGEMEEMLKGEEEEEWEEGWTNVKAVNRLAAIGKMLQYCVDNGMTIEEFMEDRTYQKVKARLNQKASIYLPRLEEMSYLLSIGKYNVDFNIELLKSQLVSPYRYMGSALEGELEETARKNRRLLESLKTRLDVFGRPKRDSAAKQRALSDCSSVGSSSDVTHATESLCTVVRLPAIGEIAL